MFRALGSIRILAAIVLSLLLGVLSMPAFAGQASLAWNASASSGVTGYKVHYGTASGTYGTHLDVGNTLSATIPNLTSGATYYFAVTAYN
ncbi:MAG: fibronectin type III domain-containing protein, partial [Rhodocyclaceae bacterium]